MKPALVFASLGAGLKASQIVSYFGAGFMIAGGVSVLLSKPAIDGHGIGSFYILAFGSWVWWSLATSRALLLIQDAQRLRLPTAASSALAGLGVHFVCIVILPAIVLAMRGAVGISAMLAFGTCFALMTWIAPLLPSSLSLAGSLAGLVPLAFWILADKGYLPGVRDSGFPLYAWSAAVAMAAVAFYRRSALLGEAGGERSLILGRVRKQLVTGGVGWDTSIQDFTGFGTAQGIQLENAGPRHPVRAMQAWLGNPFAPVSAPMQLRRYLLPLFVSVLTALVFVSMKLVGTMDLVVAMFGQNTYFVLRSIFVPRLRAVFAGQSSDLDWLGTQPGIGRGAAVKRVVLGAVYRPFLLACAMQFVFILVLAQAMSGTIAHQFEHGSGFRLASVAVALIIGDAAAAILMLNALVGRAVHTFSEILLIIVAMFVATTLPDVPYASTTRNVLEIMLVSTLIVPLAWSGISAWHKFQRRPHPFLLDS